MPGDWAATAEQFPTKVGFMGANLFQSGQEPSTGLSLAERRAIEMSLFRMARDAPSKCVIWELAMSLNRRWFKTIAATIAAALFVTSLPIGAARAGLVTTAQVVEQRTAASDRERLAAILVRDDVRQQMEALGVDRDEALARLASLSDQEVQQIAGQLDELPAGQSVLVGVLVVAGIVLLALVITDLLGITNVFAVINPIR